MRMMGKRILLVEDDADFVRATTVRLTALGYALMQAGDAISAISTARKMKPDLIILDLGLPGGDGFLVIERLKQNVDLMVIPVIVVSARDPFMNESRALVAGAHAFLQKPVDNDELLFAIERAIAPGAPLPS